jgi:hypothetical protein
MKHFPNKKNFNLFVVVFWALICVDIQTSQGMQRQHKQVATLQQCDVWEQKNFINSYNERRLDIINAVLSYYDTHAYSEGLPHLAIVRIDDTDVERLFFSCTTQHNALAKLATKMVGACFSTQELQELQRVSLTIGELGKTSQKNKTALTEHPYPYAHSEPAIALYLQQNYAQNVQKIQIKNFLPMCKNCQAFWSGLVYIDNNTISEMGKQRFLPQQAIGHRVLRVHKISDRAIIGYE